MRVRDGLTERTKQQNIKKRIIAEIARGHNKHQQLSDRPSRSELIASKPQLRLPSQSHDVVVERNANTNKNHCTLRKLHPYLKNEKTREKGREVKDEH